MGIFKPEQGEQCDASVTRWHLQRQPPEAAVTTFQSMDLSARSTSQTVPGLPHCLHISLHHTAAGFRLQAQERPSTQTGIQDSSSFCSTQLAAGFILPKDAVGSA